MHIYSYPSVYAIGHKAIQGIFNDAVIVEEKIDGSQFSFGLINGELSCRSKGKEQLVDAPDSMFQRAIDVVKTLALQPNYVYRAEYLAKPKHNVLCYGRVPHNNLIIFDIAIGHESYMTRAEKEKEAARIGLECVALLSTGVIGDMDAFQALLETDSVLGGTKVEGVVVKNYSKWTQEKKFACGKYVSERFKEIHTKEWRQQNPTNKDIITLICESLRTEARWEKAVQHLRENGELEESPRDIGKIIREIPEDIKKECAEEIRDKLFAHAWPHIKRRVAAGCAEWYKLRLAESAFEGTEKN